MIKVLPKIYPSESFYSYLSRIYCHSGFMYHIGAAHEILMKPHEYMNYNFVNVLNEDFKRVLFEYISMEDILLNHTLYKYYLRFLPKDKKCESFNRLLKNDVSYSRYLPIPMNKVNYYLRYCPLCVGEDRKQFGEAFFHIEHQIPKMRCCPKHKCKLIDTSILNTQAKATTFVPLEALIDSLEVEIVDDKTWNVNRYINDVFNMPLLLGDDVLIGDYLVSKLNDKYLSVRGEQKDLSLIMSDMNQFFDQFDDYDVTKGRVATIFRNEYINVFDIILVAYFEGISPVDLCGHKEPIKKKWETFDDKVKQLYRSGETQAHIASMFNVNHEVIRQVLIGNYDKPKSSNVRFRSKRWNWEQIDNDCCDRFDEVVVQVFKNNPLLIINKKYVATLYGLKDGSLRNLPKLKNKIRLFKKDLN